MQRWYTHLLTSYHPQLEAKNYIELQKVRVAISLEMSLFLDELNNFITEVKHEHSTTNKFHYKRRKTYA